MSHEGMGKHACWRAHPSDSMHRRDEWIKSSLRVSDLKAGLHQFVTARWRRRKSFQRCTTSCFSAKSFKRRSWMHRRRSLRAVYATWSGRHGRTSATSARDALGSDAKVRPVVRSPPPWAGPRRAPPHHQHGARVWLRRGRRGWLEVFHRRRFTQASLGWSESEAAGRRGRRPAAPPASGDAKGTAAAVAAPPGRDAC